MLHFYSDSHLPPTSLFLGNQLVYLNRGESFERTCISRDDKGWDVVTYPQGNLVAVTIDTAANVHQVKSGRRTVLKIVSFVGPFHVFRCSGHPKLDVELASKKRISDDIIIVYLLGYFQCFVTKVTPLGPRSWWLNGALRAYIIVHTILPPSPVIWGRELVGKPKWLSLK